MSGVSSRERAPAAVLATAALALLLTARLAGAADLLAVYQQAVAQDPVLQSARSQLRATAMEKRIALADYLPQLSGQIERAENVQDVLRTDNLVFTSGRANYPSTNYTATLSQSIINLGALANYRRSKATVEAAESDFVQAQQDLILRTAEAYFNVLIAQDELEYVEAEKAAVGKNTALVQAQHKAGLARITDLRDAEARYASVLSNEAQARLDLDDAMLALEEITGSRPEALDGLLPEFDLTRPQPDDVEAWVEAGLAGNPTVRARERQLVAAKHEIERLSAGHYPSVEFQARYNRDDARGSLFGGGSEVETVNYAFQLRIPILAGGRVYAEVRQAAELLEQATAELDRARRDVKRRTEASFRGIGSAIVRVEAMTKAVEAQELARAAKQEGYKAGLFTLIAVLDAERDLFIARRDLARAKYDFILESLRLEQAAGSLAEEDIARINAWLR